MNVAGTWTGMYEYAPDLARTPIAFELRLEQRWLGRIVGTVRDGPGGMPEVGDIRGRVWFRRIRFVKLMPVARVSSGDATMTFEESVAAKGWGRPLDSTHPPIFYRGLLSADGRAASGIWEIGALVIPLHGGTAAAVKMPASAGRWTAERAG